MSGVKLSPKHGVNPTMPICFFCGKPTGEIALLGKIDRADSEAPHNMILNYEPCDECKKKFAMGVALIGTTNKCTDKRPPIQTSEDGTELYPTGAWMVVTKEAAKRYFGEIVTEEEIENTDRVLVEQEFLDFLNEQMKQFAEDEGVTET